jgi:hypothetical protein
MHSSKAATHRAKENQAEKASQVAQYLKSLNTINRNYEQQYIIQMDETPTYIDMTADRTIDGVNKKSIVINHSGHLNVKIYNCLDNSCQWTTTSNLYYFKKIEKTTKS